ncbi:MAG: CehA/McbA family metallohydrolase, partial [Cyclobacteriaceae bacterium]|nr:CehA/McbA family metallohydrolase [Cyclobacteriaceae bacterium]
ENHAIYCLAHEIEGHPGAVFYHLMDKQQFPLKLKEQKHRSKMYVDLANQVKKNGGYLEIEKPIMTESFIQAALSDIDFMGIANNHMLYDKYLPEGKRITRTDLNNDYPTGEKGYCLFTFDLYYLYLNSGFKIMPTAGSASHPIANPVGYNRIYAQLDGKMDSTNWFKTVKSGNTFVTNGPMLILTANDKPMGSTITVENNVTLNFTIYSQTPIENVQLIKNGKVIKDFNQVELNNNEALFGFDLKMENSSWIAARCFEKQTDDNVRFAHTSPIFINVENKQFRMNDDALEWFISQTNQLISEAKENSVMDKTEQRETIDLYEQAIDVFNKKMQKKYIQF